MTDLEQLRYDIRASLLDYYNSQAASHATGFLAMAVIGLTLVQLRLQKTVLVLGLSIVLALIVRMFCTTFYWDRLAHAIIRVSRDRGQHEFDECKIAEKEKDYTDTSLETLVLHSAANNWVRNYHKWSTHYSSIYSLASWCPIVLLAIVTFVVLWFGYGFLFLTDG